MSKRRDFFDDQAGGPASSATREDLARAIELFTEAEKLRAQGAVLLTRVRARGDGEAAVGMPVEQHLRWNTNNRRGLVTSLGVLTDVADELPSLMAALESGEVNLDQAFAVAWPAARVSRDLRRSLDISLATDADGWTGLAPELLQAEVESLLEELAPARTEKQELEAAQRQWLHLEPTLDGQGLRGNFQAFGPDAAFINESIHKAADLPSEEPPAEDGTIVRRTARTGQLFQGLLRIFRGWANGGRDDAAPPVTLYALVDERDEAAGTGELLTTRRGLAPRSVGSMTATQIDADAPRRRSGDRRREPKSGAQAPRAEHQVGSRRWHPTASRTIRTSPTRVRDGECRMPGCHRPATHLHHLVWRGLAKARGEVAPDDPQHRVFLCERCHTLVHTWRWAGTVGAVASGGTITWTRSGPASRTTTSTVGRLARRLQPPPPEPAVDQFGDPLPF